MAVWWLFFLACTLTRGTTKTIDALPHRRLDLPPVPPTPTPTQQTLSPTSIPRNTTFFTTLHPDRLCALAAYGVEFPLAAKRVFLNTCLPSTRVGDAAAPVSAGGSDLALVVSASPHVLMRCRVGKNKFSLDYQRYPTRAGCISGANVTRVMWRHEYICSWSQRARGGFGAYTKVHCGEPLPSRVQITSFPTFSGSKCQAASRLDPAPVPQSHWLDACTPKHESSFKARLNHEGSRP